MRFAADDTDWHVTVCDKFWNPIGTPTTTFEVSGTIARNQARRRPSNSVRATGSTRCCRHARRRWSGHPRNRGISEAFYVKRHRRKLENGAWTLTSELVGIWDILNYLPIWPSWYLPIQAQPFSPRRLRGAGLHGDRSCCGATVFPYSGRHQRVPEQRAISEPGCAGLVRHDPAVDPELVPDLHHDANPLYVVRTGLLRDTPHRCTSRPYG